ncbi:MAG: adenylate kinase family protein [Nanoarchaeota archaeon]
MVGNKIAIIMVGAPGSGKGTQGELLAKNTGFKKYVMSDLIRKDIKPGSELFDKMKKGLLLTNDDVFKVFRDQFKGEKKVIIDGIPRTLDQAYWLYGYLVENGYTIEVIYLKCDEKKLLKRILKRAEEQGRSDDNKEIFKHRLEEFDRARDVILEVYSKEIVQINGDKTIEEISRNILDKLNNKLDLKFKVKK